MAQSREEILRQLRESDQFGLLNRKELAKPSAQKIPLLNAFEEIVDFYETYNRLPECDKSKLREFQLYHRYKSICRDRQKLDFLKDYDLNHILVDETQTGNDIESIQKEDAYGLLAAEPLEIFRLSHVQERVSPEYISRRKFCHNFGEYSAQFAQIASDLRSRRRKLVTYSPDSLEPGRFYVLNGIILYLESVNGNNSDYDYKSGARNRYDGRTSIIFDNGTSSDMLFRSLDKAMQKGGFSISAPIEAPSTAIGVSDDDVQNGYIYILRTKNSSLSKYKNLYKIGCTTSSVGDRIKNASKEPTYLFSEVEVVLILRCYNIVPEDLEEKIHQFFNSQRLNVEIYDKNNTLYRPREWFVVPLEIIKEAVQYILDSTQDEYVYNPEIMQIVRKAHPHNV